MQGKVKWFNNDKGYGFIDYPGGEDIFVHYSAIKQDGYKTLSEGQIVEFDLIETAKGLQAINVLSEYNVKAYYLIHKIARSLGYLIFYWRIYE